VKCTQTGIAALIVFGVAFNVSAATTYPATEAAKPAVKQNTKTPPKAQALGEKKTAAKPSIPLPPLLQEIENTYAKAATLTAKFTQVNLVASLNQKKTSSGVLLVKRPNKVRWETLKPDQNLLVSDGRKFWFYTPPFDEEERGQVIERKSSEVQSRLANALLSGSFSIAKDMKIKKQGENRFVLTPKPGTAATVIRAEIQVNPEKKQIDQVILEHKGGNRSEISLTNIELGEEMGDEMFSFTAPPNTDRVTE